MAEVIINGRKLTSEERQELFICISARLGFIETGEVSLRATDAVRAGWQEKVKALTIEQKKLTISLEEMMNQIL